MNRVATSVTLTQEEHSESPWVQRRVVGDLDDLGDEVLRRAQDLDFTLTSLRVIAWWRAAIVGSVGGDLCHSICFLLVM